MTEPRRTGTFTRAQVTQLLQPIKPVRVLRDGKGNSHVSQQDVTAHLIRVFGFGNFDTEVLAAECVFEQPRLVNDKPTGRWDVCYRAMVRLTIRDPHGREICHYENGSTATAQNQSRGDAHDLAYKSAISLSVKRAAIALGDQFGLSLYNKGQLTALVKQTLVVPEDETAEASDVQEGVEQQVSLGNDEIERPLDGDNPQPPAELSDNAQKLLAEAEDAANLDALALLWSTITAQANSGAITRAEEARVRARVQLLKKQLIDATGAAA